jgi:hypothetical protein
MALPGMKALAEDGVTVRYTYQTYIVDAKTIKPIGYFEWGFALDFSGGTTVLPTLSIYPPTWHSGVDSAVYKDPRSKLLQP